LHSLKQPEANAELFYLIEDTFRQLDKGNALFTANLPIYFMLHLSSELGFKIHGNYSNQTPVLDLLEGMFTEDIPVHPYYLINEQARITSEINSINLYNDLEDIQLNRNIRKELLIAFQQFMALHIENFSEIRSLIILQEVLS
jgi:DNA repair protein RecO (recombination protein O)